MRPSDHSRERANAVAALRRPVESPLSPGRNYDDEETAYLAACEAFRLRYKIRFMTACEYLWVAKDMGYERRET